jgi:1-deoxy-D-xylulose-5-phosphate synthase
LDDNLLHEVFEKFDKVITVEDGTIHGGFGSAVLEWMSMHDYHAAVRILGIPDKVIEQGKPSEQHRECGFDADSIAAAVRKMLNVKVKEIV